MAEWPGHLPQGSSWLYPQSTQFLLLNSYVLTLLLNFVLSLELIILSVVSVASFFYSCRDDLFWVTTGTLDLMQTSPIFRPEDQILERSDHIKTCLGMAFLYASCLIFVVDIRNIRCQDWQFFVRAHPLNRSLFDWVGHFYKLTFSSLIFFQTCYFFVIF